MDSDSGTRDHASPHVPMSLFEEIVKRPACAAGSRRVAGAARRWRGGLTFDRRRTACRRCARLSARRAPAAPRSACTPSARSCRTPCTARSCGDPRRSASSGCRGRPPATTGGRTARSGTPRAPPSGSGSSARPRPAGHDQASVPLAAAAPPALSARGASPRPGIRAACISDRSRYSRVSRLRDQRITGLQNCRIAELQEGKGEGP